MEQVHLYRYSLPFVRSIAMFGEDVTSRDGYLISLTDDNGEIGWGEIAAPPNVSLETAQLQASIQSAAASLRGETVYDDRPLDRLLAMTIRYRVQFDIPSPVLMGFESAMVTLLARRKDMQCASLFTRKHADCVLINALLESSDRLETRVAEIIDAGARVAKLKVGRRSVADDIEMVKWVRRVLPPPVRLRLDANRRWNMDEAIEFAEGIAEVKIEYIEEPLADSNLLEDFNRTMPELPLAIDESVQNMTAEEVADARHVKAVVLKPMVVGGIRKTIEYVEACRESGKMAVISSSIESSVGLSVLAHLSAALTPGTPSGLDTARLFARDLISPAFPSGRSRVSLNELYPTRGVVDQSVLEEVNLE